MCLAVPAQVIRREGDQAVVDLHGNQLSVSTLLTPHVTVGEWVLVHAGFALQRMDPNQAGTFSVVTGRVGEPDKTP